MSANILELIIPELETAPDFFIHIKKVWKELKDEHTPNLPSLNEFISLIRNDKRFVVQDAKNAPWEDDPEETEQMEELGYYTGLRIRLKSRVPTKEDMARIITKHTQKVIDNLVKTYETRPEDLPEKEEEQLIQAMIKAKKLKEEIEKALKDEEKPTK